MHAMHGAALFGLLGTLGGFGMGIPKLAKGEATTAVYGQVVMGVLCAVFVAMCVNSFVQVRKARKASADA